MDCQSSLRDKTWLPAFARQKREAEGLLPSEPTAHIRQLWANLPPFDVGNLGDNEGINYDGDIALYSPRNPSSCPLERTLLSIYTQRR